MPCRVVFELRRFRAIQSAVVGILAIILIANQVLANSKEMAENHYDYIGIQFWGDFYQPRHVLRRTKTTVDHPQVFHNLQKLLHSARYNVVNFEGAATSARLPLDPFKSYLLRMPIWVPELLGKQNIHVATLGNNHSLDFGYAGLFDSKAGLENAGILTAGAGNNLREALQPAVLYSEQGSICIVSFNRTFPRLFWASEAVAGTAFIDYSETRDHIKRIKPGCSLLFSVFHWGVEADRKLRPYQNELARISIDAGADAVVGHHPHISQKLDIYKGKPIVYSLGNFAFGTLPVTNVPDGIAVGFSWDTSAKLTHMRIVGLNVDNETVKYQPRAIGDDDDDFVEKLMSAELKSKCRQQKRPAAWRCTL